MQLLLVFGLLPFAGLHTAAAQATSRQDASVQDVSLNRPATAGETAKASDEAKEGADAAGRGLLVHGHWVIEIQRKDGTVRDRREFENSYVGGGFVGFVLGGAQTNIDPAIIFFSATNTSSSYCNGANSNQCALFASTSYGHGSADSNVFGCPVIATGASCFTGLTSTLTQSAQNGPYTSWVLNGTVTAKGSGTFDTVGTTVGYCFPVASQAPLTSLTSSQCNTNALTYAANNNNNSPTGPYYTNSDFTQSSVPGGTVTLIAGEILSFTVTITFQ
jgi:hypothetical protein